MVWNPSVYMTFDDERTRPAVELLSRVRDESPARVIDLGCGPGNSTAVLAARWPHAALEALDSSAAMLEQARKSGVPARWIEADVSTWSPATRYNVVFSNATFQWIDDHRRFISRLMGLVEHGGTFAFQVPHNMDAPSHALMRETAAAGPWAASLKNVREVAVLQPAQYYDILRSLAVEIDIWETEYLHVLDGEDAVFNWVSGTGLRPFVQALGEDERGAFVTSYKQRLNTAYPRRADGKTLFPFKRLFVVARR